ncbi:MAG: hypothetical protein HWN67_20755 [Candidatus Helarchaeota archaeon]|nr:hypothetical protein [Candidatus Helarchaeota archaeon]
MKRLISIVPLITILIVSILYFLPVQSIGVTGVNILEEPEGYKIGITVGPNLMELTSGFNVTENDVYTYVLTACSVPDAVGDKIRHNVTETNNSLAYWYLGAVNWTADYIWGTFEYYDRSEDKWADGYMGGTTFYEYMLAGYNSTAPYEGSYGSYYCFLSGVEGTYAAGYLPVKIPHNFTAVNHSIVYQIVTDWKDEGYTNVFFTTPTPGNIAGTWSIWTDDDDIINQKYIYTYNSDGTLIQFVIQSGLMGKWYTIEKWVLEGADDDALDPSLLLLAMIAGGGIGTIEMLIIAYIAGGIVIFIIIVAVAKSK